MIILFILAIPIITISLWLYLKFSPLGSTLRARAKFEISVLFLGLAGCVLACRYSYLTVGQGTDSAWWPVFACFYCLMLGPSVLVMAAIVRKLIYGKAVNPEPADSKSRPKGRS
jgi:hypothetical protein